ncbi:hypothetical protein AAG747_26010 [Rapidithrix thailandica]|uniref:DUF3299 domain-containing protein n=1 Tax=Rapidithrix thailandica TaxID=413964 RepID=A0AAW9SFX8_9BACT
MKKISLLIVLGCLFVSAGVKAQTSVSWKQLGKLTWNNYYDEALGFDVSQPVFSDDLKKFEGKEVKLSGYIIPVDVDGEYMVLSAFPFSNCFFCGNAGPETVMEVDIKPDRDLLNKKVEIKGLLELNDDNFYQLIFRLNKAQVLSVD